MTIYHNMCLLGSVKIRCIVLRHLAKMDFCDLFQTRVTLTFELLISKVDHFVPFPMDHLCQFASKSVHFFSKYCVHITSLVTDKLTGRKQHDFCQFIAVLKNIKSKLIN